jgi:transcriptional regulator with XRE-family HTH domain
VTDVLADNLRALREKYNITQKQVADQLNIDRSTYSYYETGKSCPTLDTLIRLARIFNTSTDNLLNVSTVFHEKSKPLNSGPGIDILTNNEKDLILKYRLLQDDQRKEVGKLIDELSAKNK